MDVYGIINGFMMVELVDMASPMIPSAGCWNFVVLGCRHLAGWWLRTFWSFHPDSQWWSAIDLTLLYMFLRMRCPAARQL
jgi:hypothetical protein